MLDETPNILCSSSDIPTSYGTILPSSWYTFKAVTSVFTLNLYSHVTGSLIASTVGLSFVCLCPLSLRTIIAASFSQSKGHWYFSQQQLIHAQPFHGNIPGFFVNLAQWIVHWQQRKNALMQVSIQWIHHAGEGTLDVLMVHIICDEVMHQANRFDDLFNGRRMPIIQ